MVVAEEVELVQIVVDLGQIEVVLGATTPLKAGGGQVPKPTRGSGRTVEARRKRKLMVLLKMLREMGLWGLNKIQQDPNGKVSSQLKMGNKARGELRMLTLLLMVVTWEKVSLKPLTVLL
jgi:hypothetical protein